MAIPTGSMPLSALQLIMQLGQSNPQAAAQLMASTGAQPPALPVTGMNSPRGVGTPAAPGPADLANAAAAPAAPAPAANPLANPQAAAGLSAAMAGAIPPTIGPSDQPPAPPGAPSPQSPGAMPDVSKLMQTLMAMQQRPTPQMSLGQAIAPR